MERSVAEWCRRASADRLGLIEIITPAMTQRFRRGAGEKGRCLPDGDILKGGEEEAGRRQL